MVAGRPCPECPAAPDMETVGPAASPGGHRYVVECPECGHRESVDPETGPTTGFEW